MSRPVKSRITKAFTADIAALGRLRTSILVDSSIDAKESHEVIEAIDTLIASLIKLARGRMAA